MQPLRSVKNRMTEFVRRSEVSDVEIELPGHMNFPCGFVDHASHFDDLAVTQRYWPSDSTSW